MEGERESVGVDGIEELSRLRPRAFVCWTAGRYDAAVGIDGDLLSNFFSSKIYRKGDGRFSLMGYGIFASC